MPLSTSVYTLNEKHLISTVAFCFKHLICCITVMQDLWTWPCITSSPCVTCSTSVIFVIDARLSFSLNSDRSATSCVTREPSRVHLWSLLKFCNADLWVGTKCWHLLWSYLPRSVANSDVRFPFIFIAWSDSHPFSRRRARVRRPGGLPVFLPNDTTTEVTLGIAVFNLSHL